MKRRHAYILTLLLCALVAAGCGEGSWSSGDRVLVAKFLYDTNLAKPRRYDVVVFRYPEKPVENGTPKNYIKRLLGLPGELLAIFFGRLYRADNPVEYDDRAVDPKELWRSTYTHSTLRTFAREDHGTFWKTHQFKILHKPLDTMLAMRRIVHDNDFPAKDLMGVLPSRWQGAGNWAADEKRGFRNDGSGAALEWVRYQHIVRPSDWPRRSDRDEHGRPIGDAEHARRVEEIGRKKHRPQLITDFLAYNNYATGGAPPRTYDPHLGNWAGDLMLECRLKVDRPAGEFRMELSKGVDRFQAAWDLQTGLCTLSRVGPDGKSVVLETKSTHLKATGEYDLRFANIDERLTVWVDRELPFEDGVAYPAPEQRGPTRNDLEPASLGSQGAAVEIHKIKLWRDSYYTVHGQYPDAGKGDTRVPADVDFSDPKTWKSLREVEFRTLYVQPGHYLCLGDNSPQSSDSREWGTVPERLMLGRALMVYFPFDRAGRIK